ncbi:MAG TPA: PIN domain-containing protein [Abditibacteriaceae bacterium]
MNINRFLWVATTTLFCVTGGFAGWALGLFYTQREIDGSSIVNPTAQPLVIATMALGMAVVMARVGAGLGNRAIASLGRVQQMSVADRVLGIVGLLLGLLFGVLITVPLYLPASVTNIWTVPLIKLCIMAVCATLGMALLQGMRGEMLRVFPVLDENVTPTGSACTAKFLDTNVIIDGRIADLCRTGFLEGSVFVPNFVLNELQYIADSSDSMRRARGRRGLETLNSMREMTLVVKSATATTPEQTLPVVQVLNDIPASVMNVDTVDAKLVALAKEMNGSILTNDFNLNRVAELQGVKVLNINQLALALKPVVLPGEEMSLTIVREGKEVGQGVGYLDDGTMVVVSDGRNFIGENCKVTITQVLQTVAGKMIFADMNAPRGGGDELFNDNGNSRRYDDLSGRSGGGMRRKGKS